MERISRSLLTMFRLAVLSSFALTTSNSGALADGFINKAHVLKLIVVSAGMIVVVDKESDCPNQKDRFVLSTQHQNYDVLASSLITIIANSNLMLSISHGECSSDGANINDIVILKE